MQKLYLVGFTDDLRGLVLSRQKGVKSGGFELVVDERLTRTVAEIYRLRSVDQAAQAAQEARAPGSAPVRPEPVEEAPVDPGPSGPRRSRLTPKEIQSELRAGRSVQEVARMAGTDPSWVERFIGPILAEREGIVEAVKAGFIARPRRGKSAVTVGEAILANLVERNVPPEVIDEGWLAMRQGAGWEVQFHYALRGQVKEAQFSFDPETRAVLALNQMAMLIGWRAPDAPKVTLEAPEPERAPRPPASITARATPTLRQARGAAAETEVGDARAARPARPAGAPPEPSRGFIGTGKAASGGSAREPAASARASGAAAKARPAPDGRVASPGGRPLAANTAGASSGRPDRRDAERGQAPARTPGARPSGTRAAGGAAAGRTAPDGASPARATKPPRAAPQGAGPSDDRPSFARNSTAPRTRRLISAGDEADFTSAVARTRASRLGPDGNSSAGNQSGRPAEPEARRPRPLKKPFPDDWLLEP